MQNIGPVVGVQGYDIARGLFYILGHPPQYKSSILHIGHTSTLYNIHNNNVCHYKSNARGH